MIKSKPLRLRGLAATLHFSLGLGALAAGLAAPTSAVAQTPVVQPLDGGSSRQLNAALSRLAANPRDLEALLSAGNAALVLGDNDAALGFLNRADQVAPGNPRVKVALASALLRSENPYDALTYFAQAERAGASVGAIASDRGLAYDLVGDNVTAQKYYRQALGSLRTDELVRRYALSLAIGGDRKGADAMLSPLLARQDPAAWRTRAFILALGGDQRGAEQVVKATMPTGLATAIVPYLQYMPRLTKAQQAAAANFGQFPRAAQIGRDDPRAAKYVVAQPVTPPAEALGRRRTKDKKPARTDTDKSKGVRIAKATPVPSPTATTSEPVINRPAIAAATVQPAHTGPARSPSRTPSAELPAIGSEGVKVAAATPAVVVPQPVAGIPPRIGVSTPPAAAPAAATAAPVSARTSSAVQGPPTPPDLVSGTSLAAPAIVVQPSGVAASVPAPSAPTAQVVVVPPPASTAAAVPTPAAAPPSRRGLADVFRDFAVPESERSASVAAVDLSKIKPKVDPAPVPAAALSKPAGPVVGRTTEEPELTKAAASTAKGKKATTAAKDAKDKDAKEKAKAPANPSRIWIQLAVGQNKSYLAAEYRKLAREEAPLFKGKSGWSTPLNRTNRLLVGPFPTDAAAKDFLAKLRKKGIEGLPWTSPAGQAVEPLG